MEEVRQLLTKLYEQHKSQHTPLEDYMQKSDCIKDSLNAALLKVKNLPNKAKPQDFNQIKLER